LPTGTRPLICHARFNNIQLAYPACRRFRRRIFYSSVGHGGATGYLAALALVGVAPASAKAAVLIANIFVASIAFWRFYKAGHFDWKIFFSLAVASIPFAFFGSKTTSARKLTKSFWARCCRLLELFCCSVPAGRRMM
jgi:hypothetical protein